MALSFRTAHSATATSVAITTPAAGDLILVFSYRSNSTTAPSLDGAYTNISTAAPGGSSNSARIAYKVSDGTETTSGTWANATQVVTLIYRGQAASPIGTVAPANGNSATISYPANSLTDTDGSSWVIGVAGSVNATAGMNGAVTGLTQRTSQTKANGLDTNAGVSSWSAQSLTVTGTGQWISWTVELLEAAAPPRSSARFAASMALVLLPWQVPAPVPQRAVEVAPLITASADTPPPRDRRLLTQIVARWWKPILYGAGTAGASPPDAPPPKTRGELDRIVAQWAVGTPPLQRMVELVPGTGQSPPADPPPFDGRRTRNAPIYLGWKWRPVGAGDAGAVTPPAVDAPPVTNAAEQLALIAGTWQPGPPPAQRGRLLIPPDGPPPAIDNPPFDGRRTRALPIYLGWKYRPIGAGDSAVAVVDNPPVTDRVRQTQIQATIAYWQPPRILVVWQDVLGPDSVDNPPIRSRALELATISLAWRPAAPLPTLGEKLLPTITDLPPSNPPFGIRPWLPTVVRAWQADPPLPIVGERLSVSITAPPVDNPPPLEPQPLAILQAWQPPFVLPWRPESLVQPGPAVDAPPVGGRPWLTTILGAWQPALWPLQRAVETPQGAPPDSPTGQSRVWLNTVLGAWQALPTVVQREAALVQEPPPTVVDTPPFGLELWLPAVLSAWQPGPPLPTLPAHLPVSVTAVPVDNPPFGLEPWLPMALNAWQPGPPPSQAGAHLPVIVTAVPPDNPPFGQRLWQPTAIRAWEPGPPKPQVAVHAPIVVTHVQVDNPTFGMRPWLNTVRLLWEPGPPKPILRLVVYTESGPLIHPIPTIEFTPVTIVLADGSTARIVLAQGGIATYILAEGDDATLEG